MMAVIEKRSLFAGKMENSALRFAFCAFGGECVVIGVDGVSADGVLSVPEYAPDGRRVVAIADSAFERIEHLSEVRIPASVHTIGKRAFAFCPSLTRVVFDEYSALTLIAARAFCGCDKLEKIELPNTLASIEEKAFAYCSRLRSVRLPSSLTTINAGVFEGCRALETLAIPESIRAIGRSAFSACVNLKAIVLPASLDLIDESAFMWCERLSKITLKNPECEISPYAFINSTEPSFRLAV